MKRVVAKEFALVEPFRFAVRERAIDSVPKGHVLLRPVVAGICGSEMLYFKGEKERWKLEERLPMCLLHEGVAEVVDAGADAKLKVGTFVVVNPMIPCGECIACREAGENYCMNSKHMAATADGLARTYFLYPSERVMPIPHGVEVELAALTEPLSIALNALEVSDVKPGERTAVIGDGPIGYVTTLMASYVGGASKKDLYFIGIIDEKLSLAADFASTLNSIRDKIERLENSFDVVFEAVGGGSHRITIREAIDILRPGGRCVLLGLSRGEIPVEIHKIVNKGLTFMGSVRSRMEHYRRVLGLLQDDEFKEKARRIISRETFAIRSAEDLEAAFRYADTETGEAKTKPGRVLVYFPSEIEGDRSNRI
ncbi:MAG: zinc-binding dehydrogenase [Candidatus Bathyarchaeota archaeon]|nr:zinc-binding dehydrogenase [Candidatus Bathyarchaeota archaeon]